MSLCTQWTIPAFVAPREQSHLKGATSTTFGSHLPAEQFSNLIECAADRHRIEPCVRSVGVDVLEEEGFTVIETSSADYATMYRRSARPMGQRQSRL
jgi:acetoin utilization deacetylase AcuC-like enzyme